MPLPNFLYLHNTLVSETLHENAAPSRGRSMQRKDGNLSKRALTRAAQRDERW